MDEYIALVIMILLLIGVIYALVTYIPNNTEENKKMIGFKIIGFFTFIYLLLCVTLFLNIYIY